MHRSGRAKGNRAKSCERLQKGGLATAAVQVFASFRWRFGQKLFYLLFKPWQVCRDRFPNDLPIDAEVVMHENIPHPSDLPPWNLS